MRPTERPPLAWIALVILAALVLSNAVYLALLRLGGPLIALVLYAVLLWRWFQRDYGAIVVGGLAGLTVHVLEVILVGWSSYPALMALNLVLPALLALMGWSVCQPAQQRNDDR